MMFLCVVEDVFEITGRGCVLVPGLSDKSPPGSRLRTGQMIELRKADGTVLRTHLLAVDYLDRLDASWCVPVVLPPGVGKADVSRGTEVWIEDIP